ncbi:hypothetical protein AW736_26590 [Termitidicoccus mucosus]|uniref:TonB-dependent receptor n=1 Tax=Termitidicoccus mucosus TaxID=1184151 RepID=A0A178IBI7_9BACT|nr:hypothetical protein AW736_23295 [Opitutaceae bacterium TSB47]OAM91855.1 hypothetical protein AW736_26590 [Opitutaceae bacterium TSB47]
MLAFGFIFSVGPQLDAQAASTGFVAGRVFSAKTGNALPGAPVYLDGATAPASTTDSSGSFTITGLAPGEHSLRVTYSDLDSLTKTVIVEAGVAATVEFSLSSSIYMLDAFVVAAEREGQAFAISQQRQSDVMKNVVSADAFGNILDTNAGEILKNIPGIFVNYDGEDVKDFSVRGISPNATTFTTDGNVLANSGLSAIDDYDRAVSLKTFSIAAVETIEVYKVPPPSSPANASGGVVNMITKNAFDQKGRRVSFGLNLNLNTKALDFGSSNAGGAEPSRKWGPGFNFYYSEAFLNNTLGVSFTLNAYENYRYSFELGEFGDTYPSLPSGELPSAGTEGFLNDWLMTERSSRNQYRTASLNLDYKLSRNTSIFLRTSYNDGKELNSHYHRLRIGRVGGSTYDAANSDFDTMDINGYWSMSLNGAPSQGRYNENWSVNPGVKHTFSWGKLDYDGYMSRAFTKGANGINSITLQSPLGHFVLSDARHEDGATITQIDATSTNDWLDLDNWTTLLVQSYDQLLTDRRNGGKFNVMAPVTLFGHPLALRAGGSYVDWNRKTHSLRSDYNLKINSSTPNYSEFYDPNFLDSSDASRSVIPNWISTQKVTEYFYNNPDMFTRNEADYYTYLARYTRDISESVAAGYFMGSWQIANFNIMAGARYERTEVETSGWSRGIDWSTTPPTLVTGVDVRDQIARGENSYDNWFPNAQLKYEPVANLILRAAYTTSIQRPDMTKLVPSDSLSFNADNQYYTFQRANIALKPQYSTNYDLSVEYYLPNSGVVTAGWFYKEIDDYILQTTGWADNIMPGLLDWFTDYPVWVQTMQNVGTAKMSGYEFSYRQNFKQFKFLPSPLQNLDFYGSFSYAKPEGDIEILNMKRKVLNARLTYRARSWYATVAYYWCDSWLRRNPTSVGSVEEGTFRMGDDGVYVAPSDRWDVSFNWQFSNTWTLSFDWRNILNEKEKYTRYDRAVRHYVGGTTIAVAIKANFH